MGDNDTGLIIGIVAFQAVIIICLGFLQIETESSGYNATILNTGLEVFNLNFTQNLITNISSLGFANILIFSPLIAGIGYVIVKLIRGGG